MTSVSKIGCWVKEIQEQKSNIQPKVETVQYLKSGYFAVCLWKIYGFRVMVMMIREAVAAAREKTSLKSPLPLSH